MNFVIVATRRTGSSYLMRMLRQPPWVFCHGEIFNPARLEAKTVLPKWAIADTAELLALRSADPGAFLARLSEIRFGCALVGFKMQATHNPQIMAQILNDTAVRKIVLSRQNLLAQYASDRAARDSGIYGSTGEKPLVAFEEKNFERFLRRTRAFYERVEATLKSTGQDHFALRIDQVSDAASIGNLLRFIGCEAGTVPLPEPPANRASADVVSRFTNPETVLAWLERKDALHWRFENERQAAIAS